MTSAGEKRRWTEEQLAAIRARRANLLVAAAAGAGKTAVLVERIIQRLTDPEAPVSLENLLVVTFTEAAAAEMRQRIGAALEAAVARQPENEALRRQLLLLNRAHISTIHSFCLWVVRTYFYRLDLDPGFRVMDPAEADLLQLEVMDQVLEECFAAEPGGGPITGLADSLGGRGDANLVELVLKVWEFTRSLPWPEAWLEEAVAAYRVPAGTPLESLPWYREIKEVIALRLQETAFYLREAMRLSASPSGPAIYLDNLEREESQVAGLLAGLDCLTWNQVCERLTAFSFGRLKAVRGGSVDERLKEKATGYRDQAKKLLKELQEEFCRDEAAIRAELDRVRELVTALVEVVRRFDAAFRELKRRRGLVDFGDLEHLCLQVLLDPEARPGELRPSALALELRQRFEEVLVDEYQDINSIQDAILALVSRQEVISPCDGPGQASGQGTALPVAGAPNLFMVGDVKQSIYRFRLANPELFLAKYRQYQEREGELNRRILLKANFRSRQGIIDGVNFIFRQVFSPLVGELDYDAAAALVSRAGYPEHPAAATPAIEVYLQERQLEGEAGADPEEDTAGAGEGAVEPAGAAAGQMDPEDLTALEREAWLVARRIRQLVQGTPERPGPECQVWDPERQAYRDVTYRDIVILLRATQDRAPVFIEALQQYDIPAYADLGSGYFAATEVETILSLLRVIDNPHQDIPLAAVLRSPLVGLTAGELARIRLATPGEDFFTAVMNAAGVGEEQRVTAGDCSGDSGLGSGAISPYASELPGRNSCSPAGGVQPPCTSAGGDLPPSSRAEREEGDAAREKDLAARLRGFLARLDRWRTMARRQPLGDLVWQLYRETGYLEFAGGLPGGAQRQANLRALLDRARQFEGFARHGLFRFLRFIERLQQNEGDLGTARPLGENEDVVRVMSIHKAKGLEFPVVIVADLGKGFNFQDLSGDVLLHGKLGLAPLYLDAAAGIKYPTLPYLAAAHRLRLEALSEEVRILYVAMTRAREKLILVGSARDLPKQAENWCAGLFVDEEQLPPMLTARARSPLDWLAAALARHTHGAPLRQLAGIEEGCLLDDPSCWQVEVVKAPALPAVTGEVPWEPAAVPGYSPGNSPGMDEQAPGGEADHARLRQEVDRRLSWVYPWQPMTALPVKLAVTDLKRRFDVFNEGDTPVRPGGNGFTRRPLFLQASQGLTAAERGTATHLVLQHVDLSKPVTGESLAGLLQEMVGREILTPEQAAAVDTSAIVTFFAGPLGRRLLARPEKVKRELPFSLAVPAAGLYPGLPAEAAADEIILVQGIIDCLVDEEDGFLLLDFKTGRIPPDPLAAYREQVQLYARAVSIIFKRDVKEAYLYFLDGGVEFKVIG
ncbi:ATP-dependent helicase/nuclease subunit A [Neomoorella glycerini]|uniref:ATP-dependent helicase/nuclease subunit A n=1 Tax=Neomoorella glycerini TaxID=55779 RepID=A0A6I5ZQU5_9FIRM|nr:UvrD-helicase domain-containing protein [Moorella glycerini]QGP92352.1 ATP-dependent helicase/nuclease subunit A [Moorella glycerini]